MMMDVYANSCGKSLPLTLRHLMQILVKKVLLPLYRSIP